MEADEGTPFGRYRLLDLVGKGGMGQVYRAHDTETDRIVAVKVLPPHMAKDDDFKERFRREAYAAARLSDPHVVPIHSFGEIEEQLYLDMRYIEGRNLSALIRDAGGRLPAPRAVAIVEQAAAALHAAHESGLVHRDVKPSNILVGNRDFAYLIDFGIVRATEEAGLTVPGQTLGTVSYMAPEQFREGSADPRSDIYALTCVLFECLTGRVPFAGDTREKIAAHTNAPPPRPSELVPGVPPELDRVIAHGMAKRPEDRFPDAIAFANAARAAGNRRPPSARRPAPPPPPAPRPPPPRPAPPRPAPPPRAAPIPVDRTPDPAWDPTQVAPQVRPVQRPTAPTHFAGPPQGPPRPPGPPPGAPVRSQGPPGYPPAPHSYPPIPQEHDFSRIPDPWWVRNKAALILGAVGLFVVVVVVIVIATAGSGSSESSPDSSSAGASSSVAGSDESAGYDQQVEMPFESLGVGRSVAVNPSGTVYAGVVGGLLSVQKDAKESKFVRFVDRFWPASLTFNRRGSTIFMTDGIANRVATVTPGSDTPADLPFPGLTDPSGIGLDTKDAVYVADTSNSRVMKLDPGAPVAVDVGIPGLREPTGLAVNSKDELYVGSADGIVKVAPGSSTPEKLEGASTDPKGMAFDAADNLYVADPGAKKVTRLDAKTNTWTELPFDSLELPDAIAVDSEGNVYVVDKDRVVELPVT